MEREKNVEHIEKCEEYSEKYEEWKNEEYTSCGVESNACCAECEKEASFYCDCLKPAKSYCENHIELHLQKEGFHNMQSLFVEFSRHRVILLSLSFKNCLEKCKQLKVKLLQDSNIMIQKIINEANKACCMLRESELNYNMYLDFLQNEKGINKSGILNNIQATILRYIENNSLIDIEFLEVHKTIEMLKNFSEENNKKKIPMPLLNNIKDLPKKISPKPAPIIMPPSNKPVPRILSICDNAMPRKEYIEVD